MYKANSNPKINKKKTGRKHLKRLLPIFMIIPLLMVTTFQMPQIAEAAIIPKVITKVAKKMVKEVTKDSAVKEAGKIILEYQMEKQLAELYKIPDGYEAVCLEHASSKCTKPMAVKKITDLDKKAIGDKAEELIDTKAGMTPFKKFLDWLVPIWAIGLTVAVVQYETDDDFRAFINDIAMETLYALGIIIPVQEATTVGEPLRPTTTSLNEEFIEGDPNVTTFNGIALSHSHQLTNLNLNEDEVYSSAIQHRSNAVGVEYFNLYLDGKQLINLSSGRYIRFPYFGTTILTYHQLDQNGNIILTKSAPASSQIDRGVTGGYQTLNVYLPYYSDGNIIFDIEMNNINLANYTRYQIQIPFTENPFTTIDTISTTLGDLSSVNTYYSKLKLHTEIARPVTIPLPTITEVTTIAPPLETTPYKEGSKIYFPSPKTIDYTTPDERKITPSPTTPGEFIDEEGNPVPEDDVIVSDPNIEETPDGDIVYTPEPTPENPNPTPEPITPPNDTELGHKLPFEFVLALLKVLKATLNFMKFQFLFFVGLGYIPEREIPFEMFQAFKSFKPFNFPIYASVQGFAAFTSTFLIFRVIRRLF